MVDFTWKIGGAQGEGIDSTGEIYAQALHRQGHYIFAHRHYQSLIKGGHTNYKVRSAPHPIGHHGDGLRVLVALDQLSIDHNEPELDAGGVLVHDAAFPAAVRRDDIVICRVPATAIAKELGGTIMKNMVALGASAAVVGLAPAAIAPVLEERFGGKKGDMVEQNLQALEQGYQYAAAQGWAGLAPLPPAPGAAGERWYMSGNEALALGAYSAGCRFLSVYPITPATDVMYRLVKYFGEFGGAVLQAEDELAAINMALGAAYAGTRAMTSTSGPGFSLMMEALGLAGIAEIPVVIVNVQRGGPSTGLPTKTEQGDLNEMLYGSHGDIPRIVIAPSTAAECYYYGAEAFNLAERYQCPVILASDMFLGQSRQTVEGLVPEAIRVDRGALQEDAALALAGAREFARYEVTESGISPRSIPGQLGGTYVAMGNEHDDSRYEIEDPAGRIAQVEKRRRKLDRIDTGAVTPVAYTGPDDPELVLVGWGSTRGVIAEARAELAAAGVRAGHLHIGLLAPFPTAAVAERLGGAQVLVVEQAISDQLGALIRQHVGGHERTHSCRRFDGVPIMRADIIRRGGEVLA